MSAPTIIAASPKAKSQPKCCHCPTFCSVNAEFRREIKDGNLIICWLSPIQCQKELQKRKRETRHNNILPQKKARNNATISIETKWYTIPELSDSPTYLLNRTVKKKTKTPKWTALITCNFDFLFFELFCMKCKNPWRISINNENTASASTSV